MKGTEKERKYFRKNKFFALCLLIATLFMGVGYAAYSSVTLGIGGKVSAIYEEKIYILDGYYKESNNALEEDSEILSIHKTMINGEVVLSESEEDSSITYNLTFFNDSSTDYMFLGVNYVDDFYTNDSIKYSLTNLEFMDIVPAGDTLDVGLTFYYDSTVEASAAINKLEYFLEFEFIKYKFTPTTGDYEYTGGVTEYVAEADGKYFLQVWGAKGGDASGVQNGTKSGGAGGYSEGYVNLKKGDRIFMVIGGAGKDIHQDDYLLEDGSYAYQYAVPGGFNGGGDGYSTVKKYVESPGGGATHISKNFIYGELYKFENHKEDILIVAGGGGGANYENASWNCSSGGAGGGLISPNVNHGGNGISYGASTPDEKPGTGGSFGQGANGSSLPSKLFPGGGGGYYGGGFVTKADGTPNSNKGSSGGSGYIGGVYDGNSIAGNLSIPTYDGTSTMVGNIGDGHARITYLGEV